MENKHEIWHLEYRESLYGRVTGSISRGSAKDIQNYEVKGNRYGYTI
jgi:hypothetical protein